MNLPAVIANSLWLVSNWPALRRYRRALQSPAETQAGLLCDYLARNADTAFGWTHKFGEIRCYEDFARRVPLNDYDDLSPWIERIRSGEERVLTADRVTHLVPTGGSTGARKLIPFTGGLQREFNRAIGPWIADLYGWHSSLAFGPAYWSISPAIEIENSETSAVPVGFDNDSAYLGGARKRLVDAVMAVPGEVRLNLDLDQFRYVTLLCLLRRPDLRLISVWHPSFLSLLLDALPGFWEHLLKDIETGACRYPKSLPPIVLRALKLRPWPERARQLSNAGPFEPETIWPDMSVISCWGDGHAELAKADVERRFPSAVIQSKGLLATECFVTIPFANSYPLAVTSHFFEFLDEQGRVHLAHELKKTGVYEVIVTTGGGLWRYRLRDRVQVTGCLGSTPSLRFLGRTGNVSDRCGEKLSEQFVARAIQSATASLPSPPRFALLAPDENHLALAHGYTLFVEGDVPLEIGNRLEQLLCENVHYAWCRKLGQLNPARIFKIENSGYQTFIARRQLDGKRIGDIKPCALSADSDWSKYFRGRYVDGKKSNPNTPCTNSVT
ncbi:MAG TPA: GH3 auxin-responsive promoter family protein [Alphaproteobacteria bacterium]|nr:GH3 auxin-responsive promoter family protein [Alphaproteobacteria bacterium]